jgi:hypothetical protein
MYSQNWNSKEDRDLWQKRRFLLSSFVRCNKTIKSDVYEFIDLLISQEYKPSLENLTEVDKQVISYYEEYIANQTK